MSGHVFIIHGDITQMACDAWLMPCGRKGFPSEHWRGPIERAPGFKWPRPPEDWSPEGVRTLRVHPHRMTDDLGQVVAVPWLVNVGSRRQDRRAYGVEWYVEGVRQFMAEVAQERVFFDYPINGRSKPLVALPMVGTGAGGMRHQAGVMVRALLPELYKSAELHDMDIVLVTFAQADFTAAQRERRRYHQKDDSSTPWKTLSPHLRRQADALARRASEGELVVFLGSGVSVGAGLATWSGFLRQLATMSPHAPEIDWETLATWTYADQATIIARGFESRQTMVEAIARLASRRRYSLTHAQLASLPVREFVTTNYDTLLEQASLSVSKPLAVLPYERVDGRVRWLLKLHGCVRHPEDIVLTRDDYMRYAAKRAALGGVVQALLITKHMLFIGFSLEDDNFHRMADDVRRLTGALDKGRAFGTSLVLRNRPFLAQLWRNEIDIVAMQEQEAKGALSDAARQLEIFIDYLSGQVEHTAHLLNARFDSLLSEEERALKQLLMSLVSDTTPRMRQTPAWHQIEQLLEDLGWDNDGGYS